MFVSNGEKFSLFSFNNLGGIQSLFLGLVSKEYVRNKGEIFHAEKVQNTFNNTKDLNPQKEINSTNPIGYS